MFQTTIVQYNLSKSKILVFASDKYNKEAYCSNI